MHHLPTNYAKNTKIYQFTSTKMKTGKITGGLLLSYNVLLLDMGESKRREFWQLMWQYISTRTNVMLHLN